MDTGKIEFSTHFNVTDIIARIIIINLLYYSEQRQMHTQQLRKCLLLEQLQLYNHLEICSKIPTHKNNKFSALTYYNYY